MIHLEPVLQSYGPSPIQVLQPVPGREVRILLKRDDRLYHPAAPEFCGNKWRKLKFNLLRAAELGHTRLLTFGGAYSNHILAVAAAGYLTGFQTVGLIRGEPASAGNPTLSRAEAYGMQLHFVSRSAYRQKEQPDVVRQLQQQYGPAYLLPEGGTNPDALTGCMALADEIVHQCHSALPDVVVCACGTGGTLAGLILGFAGKTRVIGLPVLKGNFMHNDVQALLSDRDPGNWQIQPDYHFGGYAKVRPELIEFIREQYQTQQIKLDPVYTGKMLYGLYDQIQKGAFAPGTTVLAIHTGGLQGNAGMNQRLGSAVFPE